MRQIAMDKFKNFHMDDWEKVPEVEIGPCLSENAGRG